MTRSIFEGKTDGYFACGYPAWFDDNFPKGLKSVLLSNEETLVDRVLRFR